MSEPIDLRTADNRWIVELDTAGGKREIVDNAYDAWLRHRRVLPDGSTIPDQGSFFDGWHALHDWLVNGLGFEGRLSDYERRPASAERGEPTT